MKDWQTRLNDTIASIQQSYGDDAAQRMREYLAVLPDGHKEAISLSLRQGARFPWFQRDAKTRARATARMTELRRIFNNGFAYHVDEFGRFTSALLRAASEHAKTRDLWDAERIMSHTYMGMMVEIPGAFGRQTVSAEEYADWINQRDMYANSCGGWAAMLVDLLPEGRDATRWVNVVDSRDLGPGAAVTHVRNTLDGNWSYVYVSMGCHAWVFERVGNSGDARVIQVWSNMFVEEQGFNFAYAFDKGWAYVTQPIATYRDAMIDLIEQRNENQAMRTIIPDPLVTWGIDPRANAAAHDRVCLIIKSLSAANVAADIKANLLHQINQQVADYAQGGLNIPDV